MTENFLLIAHRGGVVDDTLSENSLRGLEAAISAGYTHVEVDARCTKDGHVVCFHDHSLKREAGMDKTLSEIPLEEVRNIILLKSKETIPTFEEFCIRCEGRIELMVDIKGVADSFIEQYTEQIYDGLTKHGLLEKALVIINREPVDNQRKVADLLFGKVKISWRASVEDASLMEKSTSDPGRCYFYFNSPRDFNREMIDGFHEKGLIAIASVNIDHYKTGDPLEQGFRDIEKAIDWGVDGLQIDSCYGDFAFSKILIGGRKICK